MKFSIIDWMTCGLSFAISASGCLVDDCDYLLLEKKVNYLLTCILKMSLTASKKGFCQSTIELTSESYKNIFSHKYKQMRKNHEIFR